MQNKDEQTVFVHLSEISCAHYLCYAYIKRVKKLWKFKIQFSHLNKSNIPGKKYSTKLPRDNKSKVYLSPRTINIKGYNQRIRSQRHRDPIFLIINGF